MQLTFLHPLTLLLSFSTMFGVFIHDTQIYNVAHVRATKPAKVISVGVKTSKLIKNDQHTHPVTGLSTVNVTQQTAIQPRSENDKKYVSQRRRLGNTFDNGYSWPSI